MDVYFQRYTTKNIFVLHFNEDYTVKDAKRKFCETFNVLIDNIKFIFQKKILRDTDRLSEIQTSEAKPILLIERLNANNQIKAPEI